MNQKFSDEEIKMLLDDRIQEIKIAFYEEISEIKLQIKVDSEK